MMLCQADHARRTKGTIPLATSSFQQDGQNVVREPKVRTSCEADGNVDGISASSHRVMARMTLRTALSTSASNPTGEAIIPARATKLAIQGS
jgi:hypothetical protein